MFLRRLQNSYTASQRTNQELEDKLHTLVICPGGGGMGALWLALCSQHSRGLGLAREVPLCPGAWGGGGTVAGRGPQCAVRVRTVLVLTLFLFSPVFPSRCRRRRRPLLSGLS